MAEAALEGVTRRYGETVAVEDLSLEIADGAFVVLLGPTGAGKTTTLRLVAGLEQADAGRILIGGREVGRLPPAARDVAMVFQQYSLYPHMSVRENLAFPLRAPGRRLPEAAIAARIGEVAEVLRISHKLDNRATELSGGEMQRVSIGRALVRSPAIYLMDEPLSSLDAALRAELRVELKRIQRDLGATLLYVTHDQVEAMSMATEIGVLERGRLAQFGPPRRIYDDPASVYVASRLGQPRINLLPARLYPGPRPERAESVGMRPEEVALDVEGPGALPGRIERVEPLGDQTRLHIRLEDASLTTLADAHDAHRAGETVRVAPRRPLFFDAAGARIRT